MRKRQIRFILALTGLAVFVWFLGEFCIIGPLINDRKISIGWGLICLVTCCIYSVRRCPREPVYDAEDEAKKAAKKDGTSRP